MAYYGDGTSGEVFTSNGPGTQPTWQTPPAGSITIDGDSGSATGSTINFHATSGSGASVSFDAASSTVNLNLTDLNANTFLGVDSGAVGGGGGEADNCAVGNDAIATLSSGIYS